MILGKKIVFLQFRALGSELFCLFFSFFFHEPQYAGDYERSAFVFSLITFTYRAHSMERM